MWSSGVIMYVILMYYCMIISRYILLCGYPPFYEENTAKLFEQVRYSGGDGGDD